jgi:hypothetical protein
MLSLLLLLLTDVDRGGAGVHSSGVQSSVQPPPPVVMTSSPPPQRALFALAATATTEVSGSMAGDGRTPFESRATVPPLAHVDGGGGAAVRWCAARRRGTRGRMG